MDNMTMKKMFSVNPDKKINFSKWVNDGYIKVLDYVDNREFVYCITKKGCNVLNIEYKSVKRNTKLHHSLACVDFYFSVKPKGVKDLYLEQQYYYKLKSKQYSFRPDLVIQIDRWYFVEVDLSGRRFEEKVKRWEGWYVTGSYKKWFDKFPPIIIVSKNIEKAQRAIDCCKTVDLNYIYMDYEEVRDWKFRY